MGRSKGARRRRSKSAQTGPKCAAGSGCRASSGDIVFALPGELDHATGSVEATVSRTRKGRPVPAPTRRKPSASAVDAGRGCEGVVTPLRCGSRPLGIFVSLTEQASREPSQPTVRRNLTSQPSREPSQRGRQPSAEPSQRSCAPSRRSAKRQANRCSRETPPGLWTPEGVKAGLLAEHLRAALEAGGPGSCQCTTARGVPSRCRALTMSSLHRL